MWCQSDLLNSQINLMWFNAYATYLVVQNLHVMFYKWGLDSSVGIASGYGFEWLRIESWRKGGGRCFEHPSSPVVWPTQPSIQCVEASWIVMAHVQKTDLVFRRNGRVHLNRRWASVQSTAGSRGVRISGSNAGYTKFRGSVKVTGYPLHSSVSTSLPLPCVTVCHHISTGLYYSSIAVTMHNLVIHAHYSMSVWTTFGQ